jgi:hypothetical protein
MATNTPANAFQARRAASQGASSGLSAGRGGRGGGVGGGFRGGGGGNPIASAINEGASGPMIQTQDVPIHGLGTAFLNLALHPVMKARAEEEQARSDARIQKTADERQGKVQASLDSYQKAMDASPGDHNAFLKWVGSPDGHAAIANDTLGEVAKLHGILNASDPNAPPQVTDLGRGLTGVNHDGKWNIYTPKQMEASAAAQKAAQGPVYDKKPPASFDQRLQSVDTILRNVDTLTANSGATGSLGWGKFERVAARNTPFTAQQNAAYNAAYDQLVPAVLQLNRVAGFNDKDSKEMIKNMLPDPKLATPYLLAQSIPMVKDQARHIAGQMLAEAKAGKYANFDQIAQTAQTYNATPELMREKDKAIQALMAQPGSLQPNQIALLQNEFKMGNLTGAQQENTAVQLGLRGVLTPSQMAKLTEAYPGIAQKFQDPAHQPIDPTWRRPLAPEPQAVGQPIQVPDKVAPPPTAPVQPTAGQAAPPEAAAPVSQAGPGLGMQNIQNMMTLDQQPSAQQPVAAPGAGPQPGEYGGGAPGMPQGEPAQPPQPAEGVPPPASAPLPPPGAQGATGPGSVLAGLNPISSAMAAEPTPPAGASGAPIAEDKGAAAGATPLPDDVRQLLYQINQSSAAHLAGAGAPPPAEPTGNQEGKTIPLPPKKSDDGSTD